MELPNIPIAQSVLDMTDAEPPSALQRLQYLCPSRYLRFYMLYERSSHRTCWLPEGYDA